VRENGGKVSNKLLKEIPALADEDLAAELVTAIQAAFATELGRNVVAHTGLLAASIDLIAPQLVVITGSKLAGGQDLIEVIRSISLPGALQYGLNSRTSSELPALRAKEPVNQRGSAYACLGPQCSLPLTDPAEFARTLKAQRSL